MKSKETFDLLNGNNTFNNHEENRKTKSEKEGKKNDRQKVQSEIPFPEYNVRRSNNLQREGVPESVFSDRIKPFENRLPRLKPGEFSYVERVFTEKGHFGYVAPERINSLEDVAYIFNKLEDEAVENSFAVYVKNKQPIVQHLGIGNFASVPVNVPAIFEGARRIKPDQIYFVHNHPSGNLMPSEADRRMYRMLKTVLKDKLMDAILINLRSGKYSAFNLEENNIAYKNSGREGKPVLVFAFDRQVFDKDFNPETAFQLTSSEDVAAFISSHRLGERDKLSFLVLNRSMKITGNFFVPQTILTMSNVAEVVEYIAARVTTHGGESVITYGSALQEKDAAKALRRLLTLEEINFLDAVTIKGEQVISYADEGILAENKAEYSPKHNSIDSSGVRFRKLSQAGFFSTVEDALEKISQSRGTAIQFKAMLMKYGAKQAELDFMGWREQFPEPLQHISKPDIQEWVDRTRIEVIDIQKERISPELTLEEWRRDHRLENHSSYDSASVETWLLTENIHSTDEALKTWIHEVGVHHGLSNIIPSHMLNPFFEKIVDDLGLYEIRKVLPKNYLDLPKAEIGEEYLAFLGERIIQQRDLTLKDRIIWAKIIEQFKDLLNKVFNPQTKFTKLDAEKIVKAAIASVYQERSKVRGYNDAYQPFGTSTFHTDESTTKVRQNNDTSWTKSHTSANSWMERDSGNETHRPFKR